MRGRPLITIFFLLATLPASRLFADWQFQAETGALYDSNITRSDEADAIKDNWAWQTDLRGGFGWQLSRDLRLNLGAHFGGQVWDRFDGFDQVDPGGALALRYRFGLGRTAPWVQFENELDHAFFRESSRSGWAERFRLRAGVALTDRLALEASYLFDHFAAPDTFFDRSGHSGSARAIVEVTSSWQVALGYSYRRGDVIVYAVPPQPDLVRLATSTRGSPRLRQRCAVEIHALLGRALTPADIAEAEKDQRSFRPKSI